VCASTWDYPTQIEAIHLVLKLRDTLFVFMRVVGENDYSGDKLLAAVGNSVDRHPRFIFWEDERRARRYNEAEELMIEDAWRGRNIWSDPPSDDFGLTRLFESLDE